MTEIMVELLALNDIDRKIVRGKDEIRLLAGKVADQEAKIEEARAKAKGIENAVKDKAFGTDRINMDIRAAEAEAGDQERKLKTIKNQREYRIVTDRIKELKIQVDENESAVLSGMEELDRLREQLTAVHETVGGEELKLTTLRQEARDRAETLKARHAELLAQRAQAVERVKNLDPAAYQAYDLSLKRTKGDPIASMSLDGICQSCFCRQNSNVMNIVHIGKDVKNCRCQGCGRVLYVKDSGQAAS